MPIEKAGVLVELKIKDGATVPRKAHATDAGYDLCAFFENENEIKTLTHGETLIIPTGVFCNPPEGYEIQVRGRGGLAFKKGVSITHGVGTVDAGYTGEIMVALSKHSAGSTEIKHGERVAQMVFCELPKVFFTKWKHAETARGANGFGSTGEIELKNLCGATTPKAPRLEDTAPARFCEMGKQKAPDERKDLMRALIMNFAEKEKNSASFLIKIKVFFRCLRLFLGVFGGYLFLIKK